MPFGYSGPDFPPQGPSSFWSLLAPRWLDADAVMGACGPTVDISERSVTFRALHPLRDIPFGMKHTPNVDIISLLAIKDEIWVSLQIDVPQIR